MMPTYYATPPDDGPLEAIRQHPLDTVEGHNEAVARSRASRTHIAWADGYITKSGNPAALSLHGPIYDVGLTLPEAMSETKTLAIRRKTMTAFWKEDRRYIARAVVYNGEMG